MAFFLQLLCQLVIIQSTLAFAQVLRHRSTPRQDLPVLRQRHREKVTSANLLDFLTLKECLFHSFELSDVVNFLLVLILVTEAVVLAVATNHHVVVGGHEESVLVARGNAERFVPQLHQSWLGYDTFVAGLLCYAQFTVLVGAPCNE